MVLLNYATVLNVFVAEPYRSTDLSRILEYARVHNHGQRGTTQGAPLASETVLKEGMT